MSSDQQQAEQQFSDEQQTQDGDQKTDRPHSDKPEVKEEHEEAAKEMRKEYVEHRPTVVMPGSAGTVAGTAVNEWLDDDGNPKFGDGSGARDESGSDGQDRDKSGDKSYAETVEDDKARNEKIRKQHDEAQSGEAE